LIEWGESVKDFVTDRNRSLLAEALRRAVERKGIGVLGDPEAEEYAGNPLAHAGISSPALFRKTYTMSRGTGWGAYSRVRTDLLTETQPAGAAQLAIRPMRRITAAPETGLGSAARGSRELVPHVDPGRWHDGKSQIRTTVPGPVKLLVR
jgi:hypothetical protein